MTGRVADPRVTTDCARGVGELPWGRHALDGAGYGAPVDPNLRPDETHAGTRRRRAAAVGPAVIALALTLVLGGCSAPGRADPDPTPSGSPVRSAPASPEPTPEPVPTPDEHSAVGDLAEGFPADLLPVPDDAEILVSTYAPLGEPGAGQPYEVSLNLTTSLPVADAVALYRASLTAAGFTETVDTPTGGLAAESTFSRSSGAELVTVGVLDRDDVRTVTVGGTVRASG